MLLTGIVPRPYIPICVIVAFTTPITFYLYTRFAKEWSGPALGPTTNKAPIPAGKAKVLLAAGIVLGLSQILLPIVVIPACSGEPVLAEGVAAVKRRFVPNEL